MSVMVTSERYTILVTFANERLERGSLEDAKAEDKEELSGEMICLTIVDILSHVLNLGFIFDALPMTSAVLFFEGGRLVCVDLGELSTRPGGSSASKKPVVLIWISKSSKASESMGSAENFCLNSRSLGKGKGLLVSYRPSFNILHITACQTMSSIECLCEVSSKQQTFIKTPIANHVTVLQHDKSIFCFATMLSPIR